MSALQQASAPAAVLPLSRLPDWQLRLAALVEDRLHRPFAWGRSDCCLWAADAVHAITGVDFGAPYRGAYSTPETAARVFRAVRGLERLCDALLGERVLPILAQPGDVGLVHEPDAPALCVHVGGAWMGQGPLGLVVVDPASVRQAWRCVRA